MVKRVFLGLTTLLGFSPLFAGGLLTNTNQSVHFLRNPARDASIEIDAAYTNPAGLVKLPVDGFHFAFTNQSVAQTRTITSTFAPFAMFGGNQTKVFEGEASAPIVPSLQGAYKKGKWVLSGNLAVSGGGGKATFNNGLASFEAPISMIPVSLNQKGITTTQYSVDGYMEGSSMIYGAQLGGSYEINEMFAAHIGFRMNIVNNGYFGHLLNIRINPTLPALGFNGEMVSASDFFKATQNKELEDATKDKYVDCDQSGWGVTPLIGFNFNWKNLNIGMKYEFKTNLNVENKTKVDGTGLFNNGVNTPHDIPALFTVGASYDIIPQVTISAGYHHFFDSDAKMANDKQEYINGGTNEYLGGVEWRINKMFLISAGGQITRQGVTDDYQTDMSFALNSYSIGFGGAVNVSESVRINIGYFFTNYDDWTKQSSNYNGTTVPGTDVFSRTNKVFGAGVDFRF